MYLVIFARLPIMFVLKQPCPQYLFLIIMKNLAQNGQDILNKF